MSRFGKMKGLSVYSSIVLFIAVFGLAACQSSNQETVAAATKKISSTYKAPEEENTPVDLSEATAIKIEKKNVTYFSSIDNQIVADIETGSPQSISRAIARLKKAGIDYPENEKVLYNIAAGIMANVWAEEPGLTEVPAVSASNNYLGIMESAKSGIYEANAGDKDFFLLVLPSLALTSSTPRTDFYPKAEAALTEGLKKRPGSVLCYYLLGILEKKQGNLEKAISYFDKATENNAIVYEILYEKAQCLIGLKKYDQVANILDKLIVQFPSDLRILKLYATTSFMMGDYVKAEQYASLVLQQNPADLEFVLFRAKVFVETSEYLKASSLLDVYAKTYPTNREYLLLRARIQKEWNKNYTASISTIEKGLSLYPNDSNIILYAAQLASETGHKINGKTGGQLAAVILEGDPQNPKALQFSTQSLYNEGRYAEAYNLSKRLVASPGIARSAVFMHIKVCLALKYNDEAWRYANSVYEKASDEPEVIQYYIEVLVATGRSQTASRLINSLLSGNPTSSMKSFLYYEKSFLEGNETAVLSDLRSSLIANPRNSDALFRMYQIYYNRSDYRKAQYYLKQVVSLNPNDEKYLRLNSELDQLVK